ncbi:MAG TPA: hypothetical protein VME70_10715 [Mycobacteriales bacterium]|nr:hypothetical protein [Mycobacteriales bacterium]
MNKSEMWVVLGFFLVVGAVAGTMAKKEAAALGLSAIELGLLTMAAGAYASRKLA